MKKITIVFILVLLICSIAYAETKKEKAQIYVEVSQDVATTNLSEQAPLLSHLSYKKPSIFIPLDKALEEQLVYTMLRFDSVATQVSKKSQTLDVDTIELRVGLTAEGNVYVITGKAEGSFTITLKNKAASIKK